MYHLLKGLHEHLTRYVPFIVMAIAAIRLTLDPRKEEFSVIIIGLDGAGKTVRIRQQQRPDNDLLTNAPHRPSSRE